MDNIQVIQAHGRCEIRKVLRVGEGEVMTLGNDSFVRVWDTKTLILKR